MMKYFSTLEVPINDKKCFVFFCTNLGSLILVRTMYSNTLYSSNDIYNDAIT